jgi:uncharacterized membrane protein YjjP (DUF1212 family)
VQVEDERSTATADEREGAILQLAVRIGATMLASGAQTRDVELAISRVAAGLGLSDVSAAVTFSTIAVSHGRPGHRPATLLHLVRDREADFSRLATASQVARAVGSGDMDIAGAERRLDELDTARPSYRPTVIALAPGVSAAASTLLFGGTLLDVGVTLGIALLVQPILAVIDRSDLPSFFRVAIGALASALMTGALVGFGLPLNGGLVLTGSLLRFLPGYALVSGFRDLIDQSIISGTARLAEALLLGAGVAGGTAAGLAFVEIFDVRLTIAVAGPSDWGFVVTAIAALVAVAAYAIRLGDPPSAVWLAAGLGALAWLPFQALAFPAGAIDPLVATFAIAVGVGMAGRILARRLDVPPALWVVPAILPFLPGLQIVTAMLAESDVEQVVGLLGAATTAFAIGAGVASGDILVTTVRRVRDQVIPGAIEAAAGRVDMLVVTPFERILGRANAPPHAASSQKEPDRGEPDEGGAAGS